MDQWCQKNKIKINTDKTFVLFNESNPNDKITNKNITICTAPVIKYLGAKLIANPSVSKSTF